MRELIEHKILINSWAPYKLPLYNQIRSMFSMLDLSYATKL